MARSSSYIVGGILAACALVPGPSGGEEAGRAGAVQADREAGAARFRAVCAQCHGEAGEGKVELKAPSIAAMPDWYVVSQIGKFQSMLRGAAPDDPTGALMHAIAATLDEQAARDVAAHVASLTLVPTRVTLEGGSAERGAEIYRERCMECHRYNGRGEPAFRSAQLIGLPDWYIVAQLAKFREGIRGGEKEDEEGVKMHRVTERMTDQSLLDVAAHVAELAERYAEESPRRRR